MSRDLHDGFTSAIIAEPADDGLRLIYADFLEENGEPEHGEFIRVQCELAKLLCHQPEQDDEDLPRTSDSMWCNDSDCQHCHGRGKALRRREGDLFANASPDQDKWAGEAHQLMTPGKEWTDYLPWFRRGLVAEISCGLVTWCGAECRACIDGQSIVTAFKRCPRCHGTGRVNAHADRLVESAPIEVVRFTTQIDQNIIQLLAKRWPKIKFFGPDGVLLVTGRAGTASADAPLTTTQP